MNIIESSQEETIKNPYEDELINLVGFLRIEELPFYGITLDEYLHPDAEVVEKVRAKALPKEVDNMQKVA